MQIYIRNADTDYTLLISGVDTTENSPLFPEIKRKSKRYILRPGEEEIFLIEDKELLGLERL